MYWPVHKPTLVPPGMIKAVCPHCLRESKLWPIPTRQGTLMDACLDRQASTGQRYCEHKDCRGHVFVVRQSAPGQPPLLLYPRSEDKVQSRLQVNERHLKFVTTLLGLSTAALTLPLLFARNLAGPDLKGFLLELSLHFPLTELALTAMSCFSLAVVSCLAYVYLSAKWIRQAWGIPVKLPCCLRSDEDRLEEWLDQTFGSSAVLFALGLLLFLAFTLGTLRTLYF